MPPKRLTVAALVFVAALVAGGATRIVQDTCGPFTDVTPGFCPYVLELYYLGITVGTSATTFSPDQPLTRGQAAVFVSKGLNQSLARSSRRAALGQWWTTTPHYDIGLGVTNVGAEPLTIASDGTDVWVGKVDDTVSRVRASDGGLLETWTGAALFPVNIQIALGRVLVLTGYRDSGILYSIDPSQPAGPMTAVAGIANSVASMAFDGSRVWVSPVAGSLTSVPLTLITPTAQAPWSVTTVTNPDHSLGGRLIFDGSNMWLCNLYGQLLRFDANGNVLQIVQIDFGGDLAAFDGTNLWLAGSAGIWIVRASTGDVITTLTGNGLNGPSSAAFDGVRMLITNTQGNSFSLFRAADLAPLGSVSNGQYGLPVHSCSDGINFWITASESQLARF